MPRLRYRKDWTYDEDISSIRSESSDEDTTNEGTTNTTDSQASDDAEGAVSGQSWLSNRAIIGSFTDAKLRSALGYHRTMSRLLDEELRIRSLTGRGAVPIATDDMFNHRQQTGVTRSRSRRQSADATDAKPRTRLTPAQMLAALDMMTKVKEKK